MSLTDAAKKEYANVHRRERAIKKAAARIPITKEVVGYIARFGPRCRDCADNDGVCPSSGLPCGGSEKAIRHVLEAYNYGVKNGYLSVKPR